MASVKYVNYNEADGSQSHQIAAAADSEAGKLVEHVQLLSDAL